MADAVQQRVEAGLEELHALTQRQVLAEEETRQILRRRRDFEFECSSRHGNTVQAFLLYIRYEVNLLTLLRLRCRAALDACRSRLQQLQQQQRLLRVQQQQKAKKKQQKTTRKQRDKLQKELQRQQQQQQRQQRRILRAKDLLHAVVRTGSRRVYRLCKRLLQRHSTSLALWYSCLDLLLQLGSTRQLQQLLLHALRQFPCCSGLWILAAERLLQQGQLLAARRMLLTALRFNSGSVALWTELLRLEATAVLRKAEALRLQQHQQQKQQQKKVSRADASAFAALDDGGELKTQQDEAEAAASSAAGKEKAAVTAGREDGEAENVGAAKGVPQVQGDAILVVLKAAVEKLRQRPRRGRGTAAAAAAAEENACTDSSTCISKSSRLPVAAVDSRLQDFLLRALELCLGLQASDAAPLMQQQLLPPLQQQVSLLLHEQAQQQPLLRVYEWKVMLLQAVAAASSYEEAEGADATARSSLDSSASAHGHSSYNTSNSGSGETDHSGGDSSRKRKGAVFQVLGNILEECETRPHLLLLLGLLLRALHSSSSRTMRAAKVATAADEERKAAEVIREVDEEILCVLDVEGDAEGDSEGVAHALSGSSSSRKKTAAGREAEGTAARAGTTTSAVAQLQTGAHLIQLYGGAHADADLYARYAAASDEDAAAAPEAATAAHAATMTEGADSTARAGEEGEAAHDSIALKQLEMLSDAGWPQVLLLLQRQPRIGSACLLLLHADTPTKELGASGAAAAGDLLAEPRLLQLQRETLWTALWDSAASPSGEGNSQLQEQRLWLIESLLRALQQVHEQQLQQQQWKVKKKKTCATAKSSSSEQSPAAAAGAFVAVGQLLVELLQGAAAHVQASLSDEVYVHLRPLQQVRKKLHHLTKSFLQQQQQQQEIECSSSRKQHQQQVAQLLLLLLEIQKSSLSAPVLQQPWGGNQRQPSKKKKEKQQQQEEETDKKKQQSKEEATDESAAATLEVLRNLNGSLGLSEAAGLLQHYLLLSTQEQRSSSGRRSRSEEDAGLAPAREGSTAEPLPTWFQELLAAAAPASLPPLVQRFCQHGLMQRRQLMQEQFAQQQQDEEGVASWFRDLIAQHPHKRRKLLPVQQRQLPGSGTGCSEVGEASAAGTAAAALPACAAAAVLKPAAAASARATAASEVEAKKRDEFRATGAVAGASPYLSRGLASTIAAADAAAMAEVAAVLQWSSACVSSLNDASCCARLCSASRLTVFVEMCDFAIHALWGSIARCWASAAAVAAPVWAGAAGCWADMLSVLLHQSRKVYACVLAAFERCGVQQQLLPQEEKRGRGRRLQQQEDVLRRHVLQHVTNACQQQVRWWVDFWRFSRFCEEAAGVLHLQQSSCSLRWWGAATALSKPQRKSSVAKGLTSATFVVEKREEAERQAEQALGEGSAALAAFREAVAAEVATPCELQQHYPGGCTACGVNRLWCTYTAAAHPTENRAASQSSARCIL